MSRSEWIVHYNRSEPFRSVTSEPEENWSTIISQMTESTTWGLARFADKNYLPRRRAVEVKLREMFLAKGGQPLLDHPFYCFLGRNHQFEERPSNKAYCVRLSDMDPRHLSFTYGDSLLAFDDEYRRQIGGRYLNPLCRQVYCLTELEDLFRHPDLPADNPLNLEVQLWMRPQEWLVSGTA